MKNTLTTLCVLALTSVSSAQSGVAAANPWLPNHPTGSHWTFETRVSPRVPGYGHGDRTEVAVDAAFGEWQHYTDFAGLGPLWVNPRPDGKIAVWTDLGPELLVDFGVAVNDGSRSTLEINGRTVEATHYASQRDPDVQSVSLWMHGGFGAPGVHDTYSRSVSFRRGEGLIGWNDNKPGHHFGYYVIFVTATRLPALPTGVDVAIPARAQDMVRSANGRSLLVAAGERLVVIDLATGAEQELALGAGLRAHTIESQNGWYRGGWATLRAWGPQGDVRIPVDLDAMTVQDAQPAEGIELGALRLRIDGRELELDGVPVFSSGTLFGQPAPRLPLVAMLGQPLLKDGLLLLPYAYPGSLMVVDPLTGALLDHIVEPGHWLTEVELLDRTVFAGQQRLDLDTRQWAPFTTEPLRDTLVRGDRLWALTGTHLLAFDAAGAEVARHPLPADVSADVATAFSPVVGLVDVQGDQALIAGQARVRTVTLR